MGNAQCLPAEAGIRPEVKRTTRLKSVSEPLEKGIQCCLLVPPSIEDLARQVATFSTKIVQVGFRPIYKNKSSGTDSDSVHRMVPGCSSVTRCTSLPTTRYENFNKERCRCTSHQTPKQRQSIPISQKFDPINPGSCIFTTRSASLANFDTPYRSNSMLETCPNRNQQSAFGPDLVQKCMNAGGDISLKTANLNPVNNYSQSSIPTYCNHQDTRIVDQQPENFQSFLAPMAPMGALRKARSWNNIPKKCVEANSLRSCTSRAISMETLGIRASSRESPKFESTSFTRSCGNCYEAPYHTVPRRAYNSTMFLSSNQSNADCIRQIRPPCNCCAVRKMLLQQQQPGTAHKISHWGDGTQLSTPLLGGRTASLHTFKTGMTECEKRRLLRFAEVTKNGFEYSASPPTSLGNKIGPLGDASPPNWMKDHAKNSSRRQKSVSFGQPSNFRFYLKESQTVNKILMDQEDRRIRAICDRFQCDLEVYSKVPKSGFMQYAIDITAPDSTSLYACSRNLDSTLGWFLTSQLTASRIVKP